MAAGDASSLVACVGHLAGGGGLPGAGEQALREWLAQRGIGLVPVADPATFAWPGHFVGRRAATGRWQVLFGVPPGVVWDPEGPAGSEDGALDAAFVLAAHRVDVRARAAARPGTGTVELIAVAAEATQPMRTVSAVRALAGRGLEGDRYVDGAGTFSAPGSSGRDLTLVEAEALEELAAQGVELAPAEARRNLVVRGVRLDELIGRRFRVGAVECFGQRRCEPCAHLQRLTGPGVLRGLVHRGGLRADVLSDGEIRIGDVVEALGQR